MKLSFKQFIKQRFCTHEFNMEEITRVSADLVTCNCRKCGKTFNVEYGLLLSNHGTITRKKR